MVEPQMVLDLGTGEVRPDLVCLLLRLVIEADSWTVMHDQAYVRWVLAEAMRSVGRPEVGPDLACPA